MIDFVLIYFVLYPSGLILFAIWCLVLAMIGAGLLEGIRDILKIKPKKRSRRLRR